MVLSASLNAAIHHPSGYSPLRSQCAWRPTPCPRLVSLRSLAGPHALRSRLATNDSFLNPWGPPPTGHPPLASLAAGYERQLSQPVGPPPPRAIRRSLRSRLATNDSLLSERF